MVIDKKYCMSSFLSYRRIVDENKTFSNSITPSFQKLPEKRQKIHNSEELLKTLKRKLEHVTQNSRAAIALSGGIDSAILARFMPEGSTAYTFKCVVPGKNVIDETERAKVYADKCRLDHKIVEIYWEDFEKYLPALMLHKGAPIHSIEVQIYKAALQAKSDGFETMIYGESADCIFGGQSSILSKDWLVGDFIERYLYVRPWKALREPALVLEPITRHVRNGHVDPFEFMSIEYYPESVRAYLNPSEVAGINVSVPYSECVLDVPIDYSRIRNGENKYLVREVFHKLYPDLEIPPKTPMPRPMNEWFENWEGPTRQEFWPHCTEDMNGDQKWLVWCLEKFLNLLEEKRLS